MATVACASCGRRVPFVYGYPDPELLERAQRGEVVLGGCLVGEPPPRDWLFVRCSEPPECDQGPETPADPAPSPRRLPR